jgi:hypothetical protein
VLFWLVWGFDRPLFRPLFLAIFYRMSIAIQETFSHISRPSHGANFIALAEHMGHDKRVLLSIYTHEIDRECLFVDI